MEDGARRADSLDRQDGVTGKAGATDGRGAGKRRRQTVWASAATRNDSQVVAVKAAGVYRRWRRALATAAPARYAAG